jgi:diguanylate cyclase (GGDEF)-like protein
MLSLRSVVGAGSPSGTKFSESLLVWTSARGALAPVVVPACIAITLGVLRVVLTLRGAGGWGGPAAAETDDVTGLPHRRAFLDRASATLVASDAPAAVMLIDLDRLRDVNDTLGHEAGDRLLAAVSERLSTALRTGDRLARVGGDEFAVLVVNVDEASADQVARRLRDAVGAPFALAGMTVPVSASIGIALAPRDGHAAGDLLRYADTAMYAAKRTRSGHRFYGPDCAATSRERLKVRGELRGALRDGEIALRYQPKADLVSGRIVGVEALVRWVHPVDGMRGPDTFLPEVEDSGLMPALTEFVLHRALVDCARWRSGGADLTVAVNVPASVIVDETLPNTILAALGQAGLPPSALRIEITEDSLLAHRDKAKRTMTALRERGVRISLDDYGTGYCSLSYLRELPVDELKLDKSFVTDMLEDRSSAEIVRSTLYLAHALNLTMVAEGVESVQAWAALSGWGCDEVQGWYVAKPMTAEEVVVFLDEWSDRTRPLIHRPAVTYVAGVSVGGSAHAVAAVPVRQRARQRPWSAGFRASPSKRCRGVTGRSHPVRPAGTA